MEVLDTFLTAILFLFLFCLIFLLGKFTFSRFNYSFGLQEELVEKNNPCVALMLGGYLLGMMLIMKGIVSGQSNGLMNDLVDQTLYGIMGIVLLNLSQIINDRFVLNQFRILDEIIRDRNMGTAAVLFGSFVATGFVIAGAVSGEGGTVFTALAFWGLGQLALVVTAKVYELVVPYDLHAELEADNVAVGVGFSGAFIAIGILIGSSVSGDFVSWQGNISSFAVYFLVGLVLLPITRIIVDKLLLPGVSLSDLMVKDDPNVAAALLEGMSYVIAATLVVSVL